MNKGKLNLDIFQTSGVGRARNGGKAHRSEEIKEDSKNKAYQKIWETHSILHHPNAFNGVFEDFKEVTTLEMMRQMDAYNYPDFTGPISNKEWKVGYQWKIVEKYL